MYLPAHFVEKNPKVIEKIVAENPLATIIATIKSELKINHIPLQLTDDNKLIGHVAANNEIASYEDGQLVTAVFNGENAYISPNWYPSKFKDHKKVPTWNYQVVHMSGTLTVLTDVESKLAAVSSLTDWQEGLINGEDAWKLSDAPEDFIAQLVKFIAVIVIDIDKIEAKSKVDQHREAVDFASVTEILKQAGKKFIYEE